MQYKWCIGNKYLKKFIFASPSQGGLIPELGGVDRECIEVLTVMALSALISPCLAGWLNSLTSFSFFFFFLSARIVDFPGESVTFGLW